MRDNDNAQNMEKLADIMSVLSTAKEAYELLDTLWYNMDPCSGIQRRPLDIETVLKLQRFFNFDDNE